MKEKKHNEHDGHRERVRRKFITQGSLDGWASHDELEMLLFFSIPRGNTNEIAHRLINTFGSLKGVFDADINQLMQIDGIGMHSATLIKLFPEMMKRYQEDSIQSVTRISDAADAVNVLRPKFIGKSNESLFLVCLNNDGAIIKTSFINSGGKNFTQVGMRRIADEVLSSKCRCAIIAHNHPGGLCVPSTADITVTSQINEMLRSINVRLIDHIILTQHEHFSMASSPATKHCFANTDKENFDGAKDINLYEVFLKKRKGQSNDGNY